MWRSSTSARIVVVVMVVVVVGVMQHHESIRRLLAIDSCLAGIDDRGGEAGMPRPHATTVESCGACWLVLERWYAEMRHHQQRREASDGVDTQLSADAWQCYDAELLFDDQVAAWKLPELAHDRGGGRVLQPSRRCVALRFRTAHADGRSKLVLVCVEPATCATSFGCDMVSETPRLDERGRQLIRERASVQHLLAHAVW